MLTNKYLGGIPDDSRAAKPGGFLRPQHVTDEKLAKVRQLNEIGQRARPNFRANGAIVGFAPSQHDFGSHWRQ